MGGEREKAEAEAERRVRENDGLTFDMEVDAFVLGAVWATEQRAGSRGGAMLGDEREKLLAEAETEVQKAASAATARQASRILAGESDDNRLRLIVKLVTALRTVPPVETVNTVEELDALPVGTLVEVAYTELKGAKRVTTILRVSDNGASAGESSLRGGKFWSETWGWADSIRVLFRPDTEGSGR